LNSIFNKRDFIITDCISLIMALLIWQFSFEQANLYVLAGLVVPSAIVLLTRVKSIEGGSASFSFFAIIFTVLAWPFNTHLNLMLLLFAAIAGMIVYLVKPSLEFLSGILISFWVNFSFLFLFSYLADWKQAFSGEVLNLLLSFSYDEPSILYIVSESWVICLITGFIFSFITTLTYEPQVNNRFLVLGGLFALPVLVLGFIISGAVYGTYKSIHTFINFSLKHFNDEGNREGKAAQPGKKKYLFRKFFYDWRDVLKGTAKENHSHFRLFTLKVNNHSRYYGKVVLIYSSLFWYTAAGAITTIGTLWAAIAAATIMAAGTAAALPFYALTFLVWGIDTGFRKLNKVSMLCPACHHTSHMPVYVCGNCSAEHTHLTPGSYGIFKRTCKCGEKLPTTFFNGRSSLEAKCPNCRSNQHSRESTPISIPIIGGPSVGKTCFMVSATRGILEGAAPRNQWGMSFVNEADKMNFESLSGSMLNGSLPSKTINGHTSAFNFFLTSKKWSADKLVYFYDPAGESFSEVNSLKGHNYYEHYHGNVFLIDPFSIKEIAGQYESHPDYQSNVNPSHASLEETLDRLMIFLNEQYGIKPHQKIAKPIAFVINKVDAYNLNEQIGEIAARGLMEKDLSIKTMEAAIHNLCYQMLAQAGMNNFLRKIEDKFTNYRFFASSALKGTEYTNVERPVLWVLSEADKDLKVS
jgi:hypothetical protein